eukprot:TRINITY_DN6212_c0_g1_i1.p1 TRINITY_DN6212_c0_g1~~TRINITY_DN6212_c0_g1_i1.p1  ORF type:complete len:1335 (+),score=424.94 TRINITY_DN6212_c0_g1_i1:69-4073(+)
MADFIPVWGPPGTPPPEPLLQPREAFTAWLKEGIRKGPSTGDAALAASIARAKEELQDQGRMLPPAPAALRNATIVVDAIDARLPSVGNEVTSMLTAPSRWCQEKRTHPKLRNVTCPIRPGELTLVIGAPGSGCSTLLRLLSGLDSGMHVESGECVTTPGARSVFLDDADTHLPSLPCDATLRVAAELTTPRWKEASEDCRAQSVEEVLDCLFGAFGLTGARSTVAGNDLLRGVSGGERRRLSIAEALLCRPQLLCISGALRGLDAATALDVTKLLRAVVNTSGMPCVISQHQIGADAFELFDSVLVLDRGTQLYWGPATEVCDFFGRVLGVPRPRSRAIADFLSTALVDAATGEWKPVEKYTTLWHKSKEARIAEDCADDVTVTECRNTALTGPLRQLRWLLWREARLTVANLKQYLGARLARYVFQGLIVGALFFQLDNDVNGAYNRMGVVNISMMMMSTGTFALMPDVLAQRAVFYKHKSQHLIRPLSWVGAKVLWDIPFAAMEALTFASIIYWMVGFRPNAGHFFFFVFVFAAANLAIGGMIRFWALVAPDTALAQTACGGSVVLFSFFSGFMLRASQIPVWWKWAYHASPFSYSFRALLINEFYGLDLYCKGPMQEVPPFSGNCPAERSHGRDYIGYTLDVDQAESSKWTDLIAVWLYFAGFTAISALAAAFVNHSVTGTVLRFKDRTKGHDQVDSGDEERDALLAEGDSFISGDLQWVDLGYSVPQKDGTEKVLLQGVSGQCRAGKLVALMGTTGAGKTTLLDVLAGRKTQGTVVGTVTLDGRPVSPRSFKRMTGYVEQNDIHQPRATVREAVQFSARLRRGVAPEHADAAAERVISLLKLDAIADAMIGSEVTGGGLSLEQKKRVTIAVELAANPSVLFMDEPTSGLDVSGALAVLASARRVADSGRSVVCTIHQPSAELFELFDELLLLEKGRVCYCGPTGSGSEVVAKYFADSGSSAFEQLGQPDTNPADLLLEVVGGGVHGHREADWAEVWASSPHKKRLASEMRRQEWEPHDGAVASTASVARKFAELLRRSMRTYWRMPTYNLQRFVFTIGVALLVGTSFYDMGDTQKDLRGYVTVIYFTGMMGMINAMSAIAPVMQERAVFYREAAAGTYERWMYAVTVCVTEIPFFIPAALLWVNITFWLCGFSSSSYPFYLGMYLLFATYMIYYGQAVAALCKTEMVANILIPLLQMIWNLHSGFMILSPDIPNYFIEFHVVNPMAYFLSGMVSNVVHHQGHFTCTEDETTPLMCPILNGTAGVCPDGTPCSEHELCHVCPITSSEQFLSRYHWSYDGRYNQLAYLSVAFGTAISLTVLFIVFKKHITR